MRSYLIFIPTILLLISIVNGCVRYDTDANLSSEITSQPNPAPTPTTSLSHPNLFSRKAQALDQDFNPDKIKRATLLIVVESIHSTGVTLSYGMGSLVQYHGEFFLVTHNHYEKPIEDMDLVRLCDAKNRLILPIYGYVFKSLIVYQDAGTLILRAPDEISGTVMPGSLDPTLTLQPGDIVQVTQRGQPNREKVEIQHAVIEEINNSANIPVYTLRSLNGQVLVPGDSGGGVWYQEVLVANNWSILTLRAVTDSSDGDKPISSSSIGLSIAAILPIEVQSVLPSLAGQ